MVESKQVRVDNWGIFLLQRLQVFFSKTDYCDLTLQFEGNVQLKVHRLVVCACTEYFNFLEQTCPALEDNTILMPSDLQADVIVPIVNFMYTGMLEFHMSIFDRLYKAAEVMNITVLTKLLDAQRSQIYKPLKKKPDSPHIWNLQGPKTPSKAQKSPELPAPLPGRKLPIWKRKNAPATPMQHPTSQMQFTEQRFQQDPLSLSDSIPKPTRFEWPDDDLPQISLMDTSFEEISYTSKPLLTQEEEIRASTSFDDSRKNSVSSESKVEETEYVEYGNPKRKLEEAVEKSSPKRAKLNDKENKETTISIKSSIGADVDHTKIVSEILKKYPQLVKKNKNIRLKIMASGGGKNVVESHPPVKTSKMKVQVESVKAKPVKPVQKLKPEKRLGTEEGPWVCGKCNGSGDVSQEFVLYYLYRKHMTDVHNETFDARLCKYCGQWCGKHNLMMYHLYTKHGLKPPASYNFPKCDQCPYIALSSQKLTQHKLRHDANEMQCIDCQLAFTSQQTLTAHIQITSHLNRTRNPSYDCQYCTKRLQSAINLFSHIKNSHLKEAKRDGIVILDDAEEVENENEEEDAVMQKDKVKIISNVKVPARSEQSNTNQQQTVQMEASSEAEALNNVASGIATSLGLVDIVVLDENQQYILQQQEDHTGQQDFIIPDLTAEENHFAGQVITTQHNTVLPQGMLQTTGADIGSTDELVMVLTDHDYQDEQEGTATDNSNIVVLYSHPVDGQQGQFITSQGNLLVNSQTGMLEIRNDAITTTAGNQVVVNTVDTCETIESIQREIQRHSESKPEQFYHPEAKPTSQPEVVHQQMEVQQPIQHTEATVVSVDQSTTTEAMPLEGYQVQEAAPSAPMEEQDDMKKLQGESCPKSLEAPQETSIAVEEAPVSDSVDSGTAASEEPMETEEIPHPNVEENPDDKQEPIAVPQEEAIGDVPHEEESPNSEDGNKENVEGIDVPPCQAKDFIENNDLLITSQNFVFNDPNIVGEELPDSSEKEESFENEETVPEPMEVDGKMETPCQHEPQEHPLENQANDQSKPNEEVEELVQESEETREEREEKEIEESVSGELLDQQHSHEDADESEYHQQSETDNSQFNEEEDDNSQSSQDTTQSQEARSQGNINQAILEDWEDTDSQQSEKQRFAMKQAAENVNKLMDDWEEEEDEDEKK